MRTVPVHQQSLRAYPTLSAAAELLGISASTLSRRDDLAAERRGDRDRVLPPAEVLRLATIYRRRSLNEVAAGLLEFTTSEAPDEVEEAEAEIERFFEHHHSASLPREDFLAQARRYLPRDLYKEVERVVRAGSSRHSADIVGETPTR